MRSAWFDGAYMKYAAFFSSNISTLDIASSTTLSSFYYSSVLYIVQEGETLSINRLHPFDKHNSLVQIDLFHGRESSKYENEFYPDIFKASKSFLF